MVTIANTSERIIRAHLWVAASYFYRRSSAQNYCWLWLLLNDNSVRALLLPASYYQQDSRLSEILDSLNVAKSDIENLPLAPVVPNFHWGVSWGHPLCREREQFAALLDQECLNSLGQLELEYGFLSSTANYNYLVRLSADIRSKRLQALQLFPALLMPVLLDRPARPELLNDADDYSAPDVPCYYRQPPMEATEALLLAIDQGHNLIQALADYWQVDKSVVRLPLCRKSWPAEQPLKPVLNFLQLLPAHYRPKHAAKLNYEIQLLMSLLRWCTSLADRQRLAGSFKQSWKAYWQAPQTQFSMVHNAIDDCLDFTRAAIQQQEKMLPRWLDARQLALAWLARRGLLSLLRASKHWHSLPLTQVLPIDTNAEHCSALFGQFEQNGFCAKEITTQAALLEEGEQMQHCVGDYWNDCLTRAVRIVHLTAVTGETATAEFHLQEDTQHYWLNELRAERNNDPAPSLVEFAQHVLLHMNQDELAQRRQVLWQEAQQQAHIYQNQERPSYERLLDRTLLQELRLVVAYCQKQQDWQANAEALFRGPLAGFAYGKGAAVLPMMNGGDELRLQREADNPYDSNAVALYWRSYKLGYVPRSDNAEISAKLDAGDALKASIEQLLPEHYAPVRVVIFG